MLSLWNCSIRRAVRTGDGSADRGRLRLAPADMADMAAAPLGPEPEEEPVFVRVSLQGGRLVADFQFKLHAVWFIKHREI